MFKISVIDILRDHFKTLVNNNTNRPGFDDYFSFLLLPFVLSFVFYFSGLRIDKDSIETIVGGLSIFVGLLFNALVILLDIARKYESKEIKQIIVKQLTANISFSILVSFAAVFVMVFGFIDDLGYHIKAAINISSFFLLSEFFLTFLMVLKRVYLIFKKELDESGNKPEY